MDTLLEKVRNAFTGKDTQETQGTGDVGRRTACCQNCNLPFGPRLTRYQCQVCDRVVCPNCCNNRIPLTSTFLQPRQQGLNGTSSSAAQNSWMQVCDFCYHLREPLIAENITLGGTSGNQRVAEHMQWLASSHSALPKSIDMLSTNSSQQAFSREPSTMMHITRGEGSKRGFRNAEQGEAGAELTWDVPPELDPNFGLYAADRARLEAQDADTGTTPGPSLNSNGAFGSCDQLQGLGASAAGNSSAAPVPPRLPHVTDTHGANDQMLECKLQAELQSIFAEAADQHMQRLAEQLLRSSNIDDVDTWVPIISGLATAAVCAVDPAIHLQVPVRGSGLTRGGAEELTSSASMLFPKRFKYPDPSERIKIKKLAGFGSPAESNMVPGLVSKRNLSHKRMTAEIDRQCAVVLITGNIDCSSSMSGTGSGMTLATLDRAIFAQDAVVTVNHVVKKLQDRNVELVLCDGIVSTKVCEAMASNGITLLHNVSRNMIERLAPSLGCCISESWQLTNPSCSLESRAVGVCNRFKVDASMLAHVSTPSSVAPSTVSSRAGSVNPASNTPDASRSPLAVSPPSGTGSILDNLPHHARRASNPPVLDSAIQHTRRPSNPQALARITASVGGGPGNPTSSTPLAHIIGSRPISATILLRGSDQEQLVRLKQVAKFLVMVAWQARAECSFLATAATAALASLEVEMYEAGGLNTYCDMVRSCVANSVQRSLTSVPLLVPGVPNPAQNNVSTNGSASQQHVPQQANPQTLAQRFPHLALQHSEELDKLEKEGLLLVSTSPHVSVWDASLAGDLSEDEKSLGLELQLLTKALAPCFAPPPPPPTPPPGRNSARTGYSPRTSTSGAYPYLQCQTSDGNTSALQRLHSRESCDDVGAAAALASSLYGTVVRPRVTSSAQPNATMLRSNSKEISRRPSQSTPSRTRSRHPSADFDVAHKPQESVSAAVGILAKQTATSDRVTLGNGNTGASQSNPQASTTANESDIQAFRAQQSDNGGLKPMPSLASAFAPASQAPLPDTTTATSTHTSTATAHPLAGLSLMRSGNLQLLDEQDANGLSASAQAALLVAAGKTVLPGVTLAPGVTGPSSAPVSQGGNTGAAPGDNLGNSSSGALSQQDPLGRTLSRQLSTGSENRYTDPLRRKSLEGPGTPTCQPTPSILSRSGSGVVPTSAPTSTFATTQQDAQIASVKTTVPTLSIPISQADPATHSQPGLHAAAAQSQPQHAQQVSQKPLLSAEAAARLEAFKVKNGWKVKDLLSFSLSSCTRLKKHKDLPSAPPCDPFRVSQVSLYGNGDVCLRDWISSLGVTFRNTCALPTCQAPMTSHMRLYVHGNARMTLSCTHLTEPLPTLNHAPGQQTIWMWLRPRFKVKDAARDVRRVALPAEAASMSWAAMLQIFMKAEHLKIGRFERCLHNSFVCFLGCGNTLLCLARDRLRTSTFLLPEQRCMYNPSSQMSWLIHEVADLQEHGHTAFSTIEKLILSGVGAASATSTGGGVVGSAGGGGPAPDGTGTGTMTPTVPGGSQDYATALDQAANGGSQGILGPMASVAGSALQGSAGGATTGQVPHAVSNASSTSQLTGFDSITPTSTLQAALQSSQLSTDIAARRTWLATLSADSSSMNERLANIRRSVILAPPAPPPTPTSASQHLLSGFTSMQVPPTVYAASAQRNSSLKQRMSISIPSVDESASPGVSPRPHLGMSPHLPPLPYPPSHISPTVPGEGRQPNLVRAPSLGGNSGRRLGSMDLSSASMPSMQRPPELSFVQHGAPGVSNPSVPTSPDVSGMTRKESCSGLLRDELSFRNEGSMIQTSGAPPLSLMQSPTFKDYARRPGDGPSNNTTAFASIRESHDGASENQQDNERPSAGSISLLTSKLRQSMSLRRSLNMRTSDDPSTGGLTSGFNPSQASYPRASRPSNENVQFQPNVNNTVQNQAAGVVGSSTGGMSAFGRVSQEMFHVAQGGVSAAASPALNSASITPRGAFPTSPVAAPIPVGLYEFVEAQREVARVKRDLSNTLLLWASRLQDNVGFTQACASTMMSTRTSIETSSVASLMVTEASGPVHTVNSTAQGPSKLSTSSVFQSMQSEQLQQSGSLAASASLVAMSSIAVPSAQSVVASGLGAPMGSVLPPRPTNSIMSEEREREMEQRGLAVPIVPGSGPVAVAAVADLVVRGSGGGGAVGTPDGVATPIASGALSLQRVAQTGSLLQGSASLLAAVTSQAVCAAQTPGATVPNSSTHSRRPSQCGTFEGSLGASPSRFQAAHIGAVMSHRLVSAGASAGMSDSRTTPGTPLHGISRVASGDIDDEQVGPINEGDEDMVENEEICDDEESEDDEDREETGYNWMRVNESHDGGYGSSYSGSEADRDDDKDSIDSDNPMFQTKTVPFAAQSAQIRAAIAAAKAQELDLKQNPSDATTVSNPSENTSLSQQPVFATMLHQATINQSMMMSTAFGKVAMESISAANEGSAGGDERATTMSKRASGSGAIFTVLHGGVPITANAVAQRAILGAEAISSLNASFVSTGGAGTSLAASSVQFPGPRDSVEVGQISSALSTANVSNAPSMLSYRDDEGNNKDKEKPLRADRSLGQTLRRTQTIRAIQGVARKIGNLVAPNQAAAIGRLYLPCRPVATTNSHVDLPFDSLWCPIYDQEPTSIIAFSLTSKFYQQHLNAAFKTLFQHIKGRRLASADSFFAAGGGLAPGLNQLTINGALSHSQAGAGGYGQHAYQAYPPPSVSSAQPQDAPCLRSAAPNGMGLTALDWLAVMTSSEPVHITHTFEDTAQATPWMKAKFQVTAYFAPQFAELRRQVVQGGEGVFVTSLSRCHVWDQRGGKSNAYFAKTKDDRYIIKSMSKAERASFVTFAPEYFRYMARSHKESKPTCLAKILGAFSVTVKLIPSGPGTNGPSGPSATGKDVSMDLVVIENCFYGRNIGRIYDLKGSERNRFNPRASAAPHDKSEVHLDDNLRAQLLETPLFVQPSSHAALLSALWDDTAFLSKLDIMDYSLLVGWDRVNGVMAVAVIDYIRQYTLDKKMETFVKSSGILGGNGKDPTIISPSQYRTRFRRAVLSYFTRVPGSAQLRDLPLPDDE